MWYIKDGTKYSVDVYDSLNQYNHIESASLKSEFSFTDNPVSLEDGYYILRKNDCCYLYGKKFEVYETEQDLLAAGYEEVEE